MKKQKKPWSLENRVFFCSDSSSSGLCFTVVFSFLWEGERPVTSTGTAFPSMTMKTSSQGRSTSSQVFQSVSCTPWTPRFLPSMFTPDWSAHKLCIRYCKSSVFFLLNVPAGMVEMLRKINMSRAVRTMQELFPEEYDFYPRSWILPEEHQLFATQVIISEIIFPPF